MKYLSRILKIISLALSITVFGLMFYAPMLVSKKVAGYELNYAQVFFKANALPIDMFSSISISFEPAIGGFIGFLFVLIGGIITLLSADKVTKKNKSALVILNFVGIVFSLVGCLLIFIIPNMFNAANPNNIFVFSLSTVTLVAGFLGILEAIIAFVAGFVDINQKI